MKIHYHPDHLGSASFVTNAEGAAVQHLQYLPTASSSSPSETLKSLIVVQIHRQELDNETSYTYFGARYYDSELSGWLSVDPMSDKYPSLSPYIYCYNNPVIMRDPNGNDGVAVVDNENKTITIKAVYYVQTVPSFLLQNIHHIQMNNYKVFKIQHTHQKKLKVCKLR